MDVEDSSLNQAIIPAAPLTVRDLRGIVPALPGRVTTDFEDQIEQALEEEAARIVADVMAASSTQPD